MKKVAIYRNQLFKLSETFIVNQALSIKNFDVEFIGREAINPPPSPSIQFKVSTSTSGGIASRIGNAYQAITMSQRKLLQLTQNQQADIVHAHFAVDGLYALNYARKLDIPLFTTLHGFDVTTSRKHFFLSKSPAWINYALFQKRLIQNGQRFLCVSDYIRQKAIEAGFHENKTLTHRIGIDVEKYQPNGLEQKDRTIIHVGRLVEKKGTEILIDAINIIKHRLDGYQLHIIGDGPLRNYLSSKIKALKLDNHIKFLGEMPHSDVIDKIKTASFAVVPSVKAKSGDCEGLPTVIMEAAAFSLPVIGTFHSGIPEAIIDGKTGFLVKERDPVSLSHRIMQLIESENLQSSFGAAGRELMKREFNLVTQTEKLEKMYSEFL
ncbi:glycosyltransferase [Enterobacter sp. CP102]|uniref:glycosyltransferase n=1 Tax=Enterobacter sp. CP102 TaxID=2976431 RepID=UPI00220D885A|nr:glycosyltransferase [Enterobacter sp. CP102]UWM62636.1 glycosyltransferase [Enterobacter sp. CP102]